MTEEQGKIAISLLSYLASKDSESTFTDDYYYYLKNKGYREIEIEQTISVLIKEDYICYLGNDNYWIMITERGKNYCSPKNKQPKYTTKDKIEIIGAIAGIIGTLIAIISVLC